MPLVSEVWNDAKNAYGNCDSNKLYRTLTQAVKVLADKAQWDWTIGEMTICAYDGYIVMPREVEVILAANSCGQPLWARDKWFIHHINGTGEFSQINAYNAMYDEVGEVSTFRCIPEPSILVGVPELASDEGAVITVYGYDCTDRELYHIDETTGKQVKGVRVIVTQSGAPAYIDPVVIKSVTRVVKPETNGMVQLWAFPQCYDEDKEPTLIGNYYPDETTPLYRKYRFPKGNTIRLKYRRRYLSFNTQMDFIPFDSTTALMLMLRAMREFDNGNVDRGQTLENKAVSLLASEESANKAKNTIGPQVKDFSSWNNETLRGSWRGRGGNGYCCG